MAYSNAEKQRRYRQRLQARGLVHVQGWVTPGQAEIIRRIMAARGGAGENGLKDSAGRSGRPGIPRTGTRPERR